MRNARWRHVGVLALFLLSATVKADSVTFTFGGTSTSWNGPAFMGGTTIYLTAVFTDVSLNHVDLTLTPNLPIGAPTDADIDDVAFNMSPFITNLTATGPHGFSFKVSQDDEKITSYKKFDILLVEGQGYANSILTGITPITIHLEGSTPQPLTALVFDTTNVSGVYAVAKIQTKTASYESTSNGPPGVQEAGPLPPAAPLPATVAGGGSLLGIMMVSQIRRMRKRRLA